MIRAGGRKTNIMTRGPTLWLMILGIVLAIQLGETAKEARVVCYYTNWSVYRPGTAKFNPQNINPYLCTHLIYAFGGFTKENTLKPFDKYQDIEKGGYAKFTGLKTYNSNLKTMIAIGGWNEGSSRFSSLSASPERRKEFVKNAVKFLRQNKFDGLDLDWEYPAFRDGSKPKDKINYARLVQELREEFDKESQQTGRPRLLLTMAVPAGVEYIDKGYDIPKLNRYLDWMNLLSYDYHSAFEPSVNHHSPLYPVEEAGEYNFEGDLNIDSTIKHYLDAGADSDKLVLGIPTYGRSFTLFNPESNAIGAPADGPGEQGDATREKGYLAYYEICESLMAKPRTKRETESEEYEDEEDEWTVVQPNPRALGPYAYKGNQWVGYDDIDIVRKKAEYVAEKQLGGIMFWSIDNDDFRGKCHNKPYPLIEAAKESLYKSLGITETAIPTKKPTSTRKRTRPSKPSRAENSEDKDSDRNTISGSKTKQESKFSKSAGRRASTTESAPTGSTPAWGLNTPEPPTTPDPGSDFKCTEEGFFPHPRDCKKYFWCLESGPSNLGIVAHQFTCPSGLYFNKAADSCDFARNVLCNKKKAAAATSEPTTKSYSYSTSSTTTSTTTTTSKPSQLSALFTTRRPPPRITAATSSTTLLLKTTSPNPVEDEYEDEDESEDNDDPLNSEADPKAIKELIDFIKKLGGVEQLEKYVSGSSVNGVLGSITTTPATISKLLYEKVLSKARPQNERVPPLLNSRGPQTLGLNNADKDEAKSSRRERPQYTTINRQRASTTTEKIDDPYESDEEEEESRTSSTSRPGLPQYVNIRRARPSTEEPETTARYSTIDRNPEENNERNNEFSSNIRPRPDTNEVTTSKYKTIQRTRSTTTKSPADVNNLEINNVVIKGLEDDNNPASSSTSSPLELEPLLKNSEASAFIETTTHKDRNNDVGDIGDVNVGIASPSFTSENGIITNTGTSVLNAQITTLSNTPKPVDSDSTVTSPVSFSTKVTISEEISSSTQRSSLLFAKRTRPTTTTVPPQEQSEQIPDNKVSFDRTYNNIKRTRIYPSSTTSSPFLKSRLRNEISQDSEKDVLSKNGNIQTGIRKIRSTTPASQENQDDTEQTDYGNKRFVRPQLRFTTRKLNSKSGSEEETSQNAEDNQSSIVSNGENGVVIRKRPVNISGVNKQSNDRLRKFFDPTKTNLDNEESSNEFIQTEILSTPNPSTRYTPSRRFRPSYSSFESDLSSLTAIDNSKNKNDNSEISQRNRNVQLNRRFRPVFTSTTSLPEEEADNDFSPIISDRQRTFAVRGGNRFTTTRATPDNFESNSDVSESSVIPRGRKFNIARFSPRPFSFTTANVDDDLEESDILNEDENELNTESPFDAKLIGKARLSAPVINISEEDRSPTIFKLPSAVSTSSSQQSINVTKVINSNILLGQTNNRSGILLLRRPSTSTLPSLISSTAEEEIKKNDIHLSESNIEEKEQDDENINTLVTPERPRKRIVVKRLRSTTVSLDASTTEATTFEDRNDVKSEQITSNDDQNSKQRVRKVLRRRPSTTTPTTLGTTKEQEVNNKESTPDKNVETEKNNQTVPRVRKIIRRKLKPVITEDGKTHILQTKNEEALADKEENYITESSSVAPSSTADKSTTENIEVDLLTEQTTFSSPSTRSKVERPSYRPIKRPINVITSTEPSTTTVKTYSRKYINGPFTTPSTPDRDPNAFVEKPSSRKPGFGPRAFSKKPFTSPRTTTTNEDDYDEEDEEFRVEEEVPDKLVFVPVDQLFTRGPTVKAINNIGETLSEVVDTDDDLEDHEPEEEEEPTIEVENNRNVKLPKVIKFTNRFNSPQQPPLARGGNVIGNTITKDQNRPSGFNRPAIKPVTEDSSRKFNRPVAFQPNRSNRPGTASTASTSDSATRGYLRKFTPNKPVTETTTETVNPDSVSLRNRKLFNNPKRLTSTTSIPLDEATEDSTTDASVDTTTDMYDVTEISTDSEYSTTEESTTIDDLEMIGTTEASTTEKHLELHVFSEEKLSNKTSQQGKEEDSTVYPFFNRNTTTTTTTTEKSKVSEPSVRTATLLDKLFEVSRVVEVSSTQEKHRLNRKNQSRLIERGELVQEKKPTLDKIGEVSRFTLIKIVESDIPIYLTNLSHEYPVANPPNNPIRIDEARNARALVNFSDSGKENLIASESVNSAYNHRNALIDIIDAPSYADLLRKQLIEATAVNKTTSKPIAKETPRKDAENKFIPGAVVSEENRTENTMTPRSMTHNESSTLAIEGLFNSEEVLAYSARQADNNGGSKAFVVYAAPQRSNVQNYTDVTDATKDDSERVPSGRSITNYVKIQVLRPDEESSKKKEFFGVPAAVDVMNEKDNPLSKQPFKISILNSNATTISVPDITTPSTVITDATTKTTEVPTTTIASTTDTPTTESTIVKIKSASITNSTLTKIAKKRPKLTFPRRPQTNLKSSNITRLSIIPTANKATNLTIEGKNIPFTTPKYNRTNSYTSGRSRFSAIRSQNVPVDNRKPNSLKNNPTTEATKISNPSIRSSDTNKKITIKPLRPGLLRGSTFSPRRTTLPPSQVESITLQSPSSPDNAIKPKLQESSDQNKLFNKAKPAFFPRRSSGRFTTRSTTTVAPESSRSSTPSLPKRRLSLERRRPTSSPVSSRNVTEVAGGTKAPSARPTRLFVRKYTSPRSGISTTRATTTSAPAAKLFENTSRKNFRVGIRRRPSVITSSTTRAEEETTIPPSKVDIETDQESHSTITLAKENFNEDSEKLKVVKIKKRPSLLSSNAFKVNQINTEEKIYSSVIKEDHTLVQQQKNLDVNKNEIKYDGLNVEEVTADVAVVAHQLLSAPLPTIPSYVLDDDQDKSDNSDRQFTRAYLLASSVSPIVTNDYISTTVRPVLKFTNPVTARRISTTVTPFVRTSVRTNNRRNPPVSEQFERIEPVVKHYRQFDDYEYYDDDDIRIVGKTPVQGKVVVHGKGVIQCLDQGNFPHPESCKKFISCARMENGEVYGWAYTCPIGLSFDPVGGICNWSAGLGCGD